MKDASMSYLWREIHQQPAVLAEVLQADRNAVNGVVKAIGARTIEFVYIVARGSSDNAARYAKYLFSALNRLPVALAAPSLFTRYLAPPQLDKALVIGISQSGQTAEGIEVLAEARSQGACTLAITNDSQSPLAETAENLLLCHAGMEQSLAATKTYTAQMTCLAMLSATLTGDENRIASLDSLPPAAEAALALDDSIRRSAIPFAEVNRCVVIGRGYNLSTAFEIALKLKEVTYVFAEAYSSADFRHGPMAMISAGDLVVAIASKGKVDADIRSLLSELKDRQAQLIVIADQSSASDDVQQSFASPIAVEEWLSPVINVIPGQLFALHLALAKGIDPDRPRGLSKVTMTS